MRFESSKADNGRIPSVEERMQLSYDIFKIDNTEMARVLTIIETSCPSALTKKVMKYFTHIATCTLLCGFYYFSLSSIYYDDSKSVNTGRHSDV